MIDFEPFVEGLTKIGVALRQPYDAVSLTVYHDVIGPHTSGEEWARFVTWGLERERWPTFAPKVPELQNALREFRGQRPLLVEGTDAYERVLAAGVYTPEGGTSWNYRAVKESCGDAAAEAFLAAGGNSAFATTWDEAKRRERFVAAYVEAVREEPMAALLPPGQSVKALPPVHEATREEAGEVIRKLQEMVDVEPPPPAVVTLSEEREAELKRQAAEIQA